MTREEAEAEAHRVFQCFVEELRADETVDAGVHAAINFLARVRAQDSLDGLEHLLRYYTGWLLEQKLVDHPHHVVVMPPGVPVPKGST